MSKTLIDLDDQLLQQVRMILGTGTKKGDTVNHALREIVRRDAAHRFMSAVRDGAFEPSASDRP